MALLLIIFFPLVGCLVIAFGVLTAVFSERSARIQQRMSLLRLFGRDPAKVYTPELMRGMGAVIGLFGVIWLGLYLAAMYGSK
jgi:hypothetical protein